MPLPFGPSPLPTTWRLLHQGAVEYLRARHTPTRCLTSGCKTKGTCYALSGCSCGEATSWNVYHSIDIRNGAQHVTEAEESRASGCRGRSQDCCHGTHGLCLLPFCFLSNVYATFVFPVRCLRNGPLQGLFEPHVCIS